MGMRASQAVLCLPVRALTVCFCKPLPSANDRACATLTPPAQHSLPNRVDEGALLGAGAQILLLEAVIPLGLGVGVVDEEERWLMLQPLLLAHHDVAILAQEGAHIGPEQRLQRLEPRHRPVDRVIYLALAVGERRHCREIDQRVAAGAD